MLTSGLTAEIAASSDEPSAIRCAIAALSASLSVGFAVFSGFSNAWRERQRAWYAGCGLEWSEDAPIVSSRVGNHTLQRSFGKWFAEARKRYPVPDDFTVHGLRHTFVTFLDRDCQVDTTTTKSMSGHKDEAAFHTYTHTNDEWRRKAAVALGGMIAPDPDSARCLNCKLWTMSPLDATKGACWADADAPAVTGAVEPCARERFAMRMSA